jgi:hydrogenase maturation protease
VRGGEFVSLVDPPAELGEAAGECRSVGAWPVLVGDPGARDLVLSAPIILADYPQVAPQSPGDFFDATEIDELLTLRVLTLTDAEKQAMQSGDARARTLLERTEALTDEQRRRLHGIARTRRPSETPEAVLQPGTRVRLVPRPGGDVFDIALAGRMATVVKVEESYEGDIFIAVTVDDDPGRDLGADGRPGHRFFFRRDEVEVVS